MDDSIEKQQSKQQQLQLQQTSTTGQLSPKLNQKSLNLELEEKLADKTDIKRASHKVAKSDFKPVYMFNRLPGAPWVSKKVSSNLRNKSKLIFFT